MVLTSEVFFFPFFSWGQAGRDTLRMLALLDAAVAHLFAVDAGGRCLGGYGGVPPLHIYMATLVEVTPSACAAHRDNPLGLYHSLRILEAAPEGPLQLARLSEISNTLATH